MREQLRPPGSSILNPHNESASEPVKPRVSCALPLLRSTKPQRGTLAAMRGVREISADTPLLHPDGPGRHSLMPNLIGLGGTPCTNGAQPGSRSKAGGDGNAIIGRRNRR